MRLFLISFPLLNYIFLFGKQNILTPQVITCLEGCVSDCNPVLLHISFLTLSSQAKNNRFQSPASQLIHYSCGMFTLNGFVKSNTLPPTALPLIVEHLSIVWSSKKVSSDDVLLTTTNYIQSQACAKVVHAVNKVLSGYQGPIPFQYRYTSCFTMLTPLILHIEVIGIIGNRNLLTTFY